MSHKKAYFLAETIASRANVAGRIGLPKGDVVLEELNGGRRHLSQGHENLGMIHSSSNLSLTDIEARSIKSRCPLEFEEEARGEQSHFDVDNLWITFACIDRL